MYNEFYSMTEIKIKNQKEFINWVNEKMTEIGMSKKELALTIGCGPTYLTNLLNHRTGFRGSKWNDKIKKAITNALEQQSAVI